jgi:hypothetical protein
VRHQKTRGECRKQKRSKARPTRNIGCPTSSGTQANLTIKINFNILRSFSSSYILTIYLHAFLQSLHPSIREKPRSRSPAGFPSE